MTDLPGVSPKGLEVVEELVKDFSSDLYDESGRIAKRHQAELASAEHVRMAGRHLYQSSGSRVTALANALGGLIAGIGGSVAAAELRSDNPEQVPTTIGVIAFVIGMGMVIAGWRTR